MQEKGYSHTGANIGVNYKYTDVDPKYNLPKYGNSKPQLLSYSTKNSNLLFH